MAAIRTTAKQWLLPAGQKPRTLLRGLGRGLRMQVDFSKDTLLYMGLQEAELAPYFTALCKGARSAIDIGGAYGYYTLFFLKQPQLEQITVFEPEDTCHPALLENIALNAATVPTGNRLSVRKQFVGTEDSIDTCRLSPFLEATPKPCVLKMDVEGAEAGILESCGPALKTQGLRWIIETHSREQEDRCWKRLQSYGYTCQIVDKAWWRLFLPEQRPAEHNRWLIATNDHCVS